MSWKLTSDVEAYAQAVSGLLGAEPERYTVLSTVLASLVKHGPNVYGDDPPILAWWLPDGKPDGDSGPTQAQAAARMIHCRRAGLCSSWLRANCQKGDLDR